MTHTSTEQPWWRKHTDEIELKVARGEMNASTCFTKMLWLVSEASQAQRSTGYIAPKGRYVPPVLFNPYSGEPRDARDIASDPRGVLIVPPGAALAAHGITQEKQGCGSTR